VWDVEDQLTFVDRQGGGQAHYAYDAMGQRVRKVVVKNNGALVEERIYVGGYEIYRRRENNAVTVERQTLHVMDDTKRIALVETQTRNAQGVIQHPPPVVRFQLGNHLGSAALELDENGAIISYEEYYPYGGTAYQGGTAVARASLKRFRYIGKERDEETGFYYCRARYYAPWLGRWVSPDPLGIDGGQNLYEYSASNPLVYKDETGTAPTLTPLEAASVAEESGKGALMAKYSKVAEVVDVTPVKNVSANGVDAHLVAGKGPAAVNIIGDVKHANAPSKTGGSLIYSGKEVAGEISAFENAAKQQHGQLVRNLRAARASGSLDPATAFHAIEGAKAGQVIHEVVPSGYNTGVEKTIVGKYQANVTPNDTFAEASAHRQGLDLKEATKGPSKGKQANPETVFKRIQKAAKSGGKAKSGPSPKAAGVAGATKAAALETPVAASATKAATAPKPVSAAAASGGTKLLSGAKSMAGGTLAVAGSALGGWQVGSGINAVIEGRTGEGAVDIAEGGANLAMSLGGAYAVKTGALVVGGGSVLATAAGAAAGVSVALAAETVRAAMKGEPTPVDVADAFYGTHFGDIAGWVRGDYSKK
jgi:RHS repeat-associated protein